MQGGSPELYCAGVIVTHVVGWIFLICAGTRMRRTLREEDRPVVVSRPAEVRSYRPISSTRSRWPSMLPPVEWLVRRQRGLKTIIWSGVVAGFLYYVFFRFAWRTGMGGSGAFAVWIPNILIGCFTGMFFAWAASRFFVEIRRTGELELLLTTPVGARTVVRDQWNVLSGALLLPLAVSALGILIPSIFTVLMQGGSVGTTVTLFPFLLMTLPGTLNMVVGTYALCRVGLWFGLKASGQGSAILWTLGVVKSVPYLLGFGWGFVSGILSLRSRESWYLLSLVPTVPTLIFYLWIIQVAKQGVLRELSGTSDNLVAPLVRARRELTNAFQRFRNWKTA
jgi:hypothetical protein